MEQDVNMNRQRIRKTKISTNAQKMKLKKSVKVHATINTKQEAISHLNLGHVLCANMV